MTAGSDKDGHEQEKYNVFRHSPLRYMGYANEVGESFRYQFPKFVMPSYVLSFGYCVMDAATNGYDTWTTSANEPTTEKDRSREMKTAIETFDTLVWQSLASVMIPGAAINMIVKASRFALGRPPVPTVVAGWGPTAIGLGSIPLIIHPIDDFVDYLLDNTMRKILSEDFAEDKRTT